MPSPWVLVIENDLTNQLAIRQWVEQGQATCHCEYVTSLAAGEASLSAHPVDCVAINVALADGSFPDLCTQLQTRNIPLIVLGSPGTEAQLVQ